MKTKPVKKRKKITKPKKEEELFTWNDIIQAGTPSLWKD